MARNNELRSFFNVVIVIIVLHCLPLLQYCKYPFLRCPLTPQQWLLTLPPTGTMALAAVAGGTAPIAPVVETENNLSYDEPLVGWKRQHFHHKTGKEFQALFKLFWHVVFSIFNILDNILHVQSIENNLHIQHIKWILAFLTILQLFSLSCA